MEENRLQSYATHLSKSTFPSNHFKVESQHITAKFHLHLTMTTTDHLQTILDNASISPEVFTLRPDYRALLLIISGIKPGPSDSTSESLIQSAEAVARQTLSKTPVTEIPHVAAWREAYKAFGSKPQKYRNSLEALTRRVTPDVGLPRVNRLTDIYNALSVKYQISLGGEDLDRYIGAPRCIRASGKEVFETTSKGEAVVEHPDIGEVVWCDDRGITCRRWNWRQGPRTALTEETKNALFIMNALNPFTDEMLNSVADELVEALRDSGSELKVVRRIIRA